MVIRLEDYTFISSLVFLIITLGSFKININFSIHMARFQVRHVMNRIPRCLRPRVRFLILPLFDYFQVVVLIVFSWIICTRELLPLGHHGALLSRSSLFRGIVLVSSFRQFV